MNPNDFSAIWTAAIQHSQSTHRPRPRSVLVLYADGSVAEVKADGRGVEEWGDSPGAFPAEKGWSFRAGMAAFHGHAFSLAGLRYKLLRALVDGTGEPVRDRVLKAKVWGNSAAEDGRLKDVAFGLRAVLRAELRMEDGFDPIERVEGGYRLVVGSA